MLRAGLIRFSLARNRALFASCVLSFVHTGTFARETDRISTDRLEHTGSSNEIGIGFDPGKSGACVTQIFR